jgi:hypothetical protein
MDVPPDGRLPKAPYISSSATQTRLSSASTLKESFAETVAPASDGVSPAARFVRASGDERPGEHGKYPISASEDAFILPNNEMLHYCLPMLLLLLISMELSLNPSNSDGLSGKEDPFLLLFLLLLLMAALNQHARTR